MYCVEEMTGVSVFCFVFSLFELPKFWVQKSCMTT